MPDLLILVLAACIMGFTGFLRTRSLRNKFMDQKEGRKEDKDDSERKN